MFSNIRITRLLIQIKSIIFNDLTKIIKSPKIFLYIINYRAIQFINCIFNYKRFRDLTLILNQEYYINLLDNHGKLKYKWLKKSLGTKLNASQRLEILIHHYNYVKINLDKVIFNEKIYIGIELWVKKYDDNEIKITLASLDKKWIGRREGELILNYIFNEQVIYSLAFTIAPGSLFNCTYKDILFISGMQSNNKFSYEYLFAKKILLEVTPQKILFFALIGVAEGLKIKCIKSVSAKTRADVRESVSIFINTYDLFLDSIYGIKRGINDYYSLEFPWLDRPRAEVRRCHRGRSLRRTVLKREIIESVKDKIYSIKKIHFII